MRRKAGTDAGYRTRDLGKRLFFFGSQGQWDVVGAHSPNSQISRMSLLLPTLLLLHFVSNKIISQSNAGHTFKYSPV